MPPFATTALEVEFGTPLLQFLDKNQFPVAGLAQFVFGPGVAGFSNFLPLSMKVAKSKDGRTTALVGVSREMWKLPLNSVGAIPGLVWSCRSIQSAAVGRYQSGVGCACKALDVRKTPKTVAH